MALCGKNAAKAHCKQTMTSLLHGGRQKLPSHLADTVDARQTLGKANDSRLMADKHRFALPPQHQRRIRNHVSVQVIRLYTATIMPS